MYNCMRIITTCTYVLIFLFFLLFLSGCLASENIDIMVIMECVIMHHMVADMTRFYCLTLDLYAEGNKMTSALKSFKYYMFLRLTIMHIYECVNNVIYSQLCIF